MILLREHIYKRYLRSSDWPKLRKIIIRKHPYCSVCGSTKGLEVHHIIPVHIAPDLELDERNCLVLCRPKRCHLLFGHLNSWKKHNPYVLYDTYRWFELINGRPDKKSHFKYETAK